MDNESQETAHNSNDLLTSDEAAARLRVTSEQVRSLIRRGRISAINVGIGTKRPLYRITKQAFDDFIKQRSQTKSAVQHRRFKRLVPVQDFFPHLK